MKSMISCVRLKGCNRWEGVSWFVVVVIFCLPVKRITEIKQKKYHSKNIYRKNELADRNKVH